MLNNINCCVLALIAFIGNIVQLVFFFNYSLKLKDKSLQLEKQDKKRHQQNCQRIEELEKKNGAEQRQINELKEEIKKLQAEKK